MNTRSFTDTGNSGRRRLHTLVLCLAVILAACTSAGAVTESTKATTATTGTGAAESDSDAVFDATSLHEISFTFDQDAYDEMVTTYQETGEKVWIEATVTIDGETYQSAGVRLKGNSSLRGLGGDNQGGGPGGGESVDPSQPQSLPWLIKLDKYVEDQAHQGVSDFVVRSSSSETGLNEAVALDLLELAGLASQDAMYTSLTVNGSDPVLRLVIEHPDDVWMAENFTADGALYKAEASGSYDYLGSDPTSYDEVFDQEAGSDNTDLTPLIEFLDFINNSDDETFDADLGEHLDIDEFATYLAMQELIANFDDIDGPGNNSYLYYDPDSGSFTVVAWDHNLAFGGFGGGGFPGGGQGFPPDGGQGFPPDGEEQGFPPDGGQQGIPPDGRDLPDTGRPGGDGFGPGGGNILVERFLDNPEWNALYEDKLTELTVELIDSGTAEEVLDTWAGLLTAEAGGLVTADTVAAEVDRIAGYFTG